MGGSRRIGAAWSDLPQEIVEKIANCLDTETDVLRFRAICSSWRSATTPFKRFPPTPLKLPFPVNPGKPLNPRHKDAYYILIERTVYRVQLPEITEPRFWLVKTERSSDGKLRILNPVSDHQIKILPQTQLPKLLNTLDFRISEVCKGYTLRYMNPAKSKKNHEYKLGKSKKVIVSGDAKNDEYFIMAILNNELWSIKSGDENWTMVRWKWGYSDCIDVASHNGEIYGIDVAGCSWVFDSMFEPRNIGRSMYKGASKRHLVELYKGELIFVECFPTVPVRKAGAMIKISRIDNQRGKWPRWVEVKTVGHQIIFVGEDCSFSVPAEEFEGCKGTRVFYTNRHVCFLTEERYRDAGYDKTDPHDYYFVPSDDVKLKFRELHGHNMIGVRDFATGKTGSVLMFPEYADIFWPPPSCLTRT